MQECETGTGKSSFVKRVSVRSGGAGHAHSGIVKVHGMPEEGGTRSPKGVNGKIVNLAGKTRPLGVTIDRRHCRNGRSTLGLAVAMISPAVTVKMPLLPLIGARYETRTSHLPTGLVGTVDRRSGAARPLLSNGSRGSCDGCGLSPGRRRINQTSLSGAKPVQLPSSFLPAPSFSLALPSMPCSPFLAFPSDCAWCAIQSPSLPPC